jgi:hypothetical protein
MYIFSELENLNENLEKVNKWYLENRKDTYSTNDNKKLRMQRKASIVQHYHFFLK